MPSAAAIRAAVLAASIPTPRHGLLHCSQCQELLCAHNYFSNAQRKKGEKRRCKEQALHKSEHEMATPPYKAACCIARLVPANRSTTRGL